MGKTLILCGGAGAGSSGKAKTLRLKISGVNKNIVLKIEDISRRMLADVPPVLTDLLEIAAYVYCADQLVSRGGDTMQNLGADWRRDLRFVIPVREPELWQAPEIRDNLERLLAFMSEDTIRFDFIPAEDPVSIDSYLNLASGAVASFLTEDVALFSGGLDSLAGAVETLEREKAKLLLVSHQSSTKIAGHQRHLVRELHRRFPGKLLHVPVRITKKGMRTVETTQRSRSFLFAAVAVTVSRLSGLDGIRFFENGVVSFNLPIAGQIIGARATRSTHPRVMHYMQVFFSALLERAIQINNPYIWKTKTEVASVLKASSHGDLLPHSVSCSHSYGMTRLKTHCGRCSQCLDRRFGTLAAGMADVDPQEMWELRPS
jgi:7-cyano-7-deazaguanine synthase in queuosine biosynthesis